MNYITGERLQELAEISVALNVDSNFASDLVKTQLRNTRTECIVFEQHVTDFTIPDKLKFAKSIFVYPHILDYFFAHVYPQIESEFILITHNSDAGADERYKSFLDTPKIKKWFCQNKYFNHKKLFALPIGIANSQWPHGNIAILQAVAAEPYSKTKLVYKNFDMSTNPGARHHANSVTAQNGFEMEPSRSFEDYIRGIKQSYFSFSPPGNGIDCHRIWECLYLGCIPVVLKNNVSFGEFNDLPILFVDNFSDATKDFLESQISNYHPLTPTNYKKLDLTYWRDYITN